MIFAPLMVAALVSVSAEEAGARLPAPPPGIAAPTVAFESDTPPPTPYDEVQDKSLLTPESHGLLAQLGRTVVALFLVVALIYLTMKLLLPKLLKKLPQRGVGTHLRMVERLQLDATHHVVLLDVQNGPRVLLGTSEKGVEMLTSWGAQVSTDFTKRMHDTPNPLPSEGVANASN